MYASHIIPHEFLTEFMFVLKKLFYTNQPRLIGHWLWRFLKQHLKNHLSEVCQCECWEICRLAHCCG